MPGPDTRDCSDCWLHEHNHDQTSANATERPADPTHPTDTTYSADPTSSNKSIELDINDTGLHNFFIFNNDFFNRHLLFLRIVDEEIQAAFSWHQYLNEEDLVNSL